MLSHGPVRCATGLVVASPSSAVISIVLLIMNDLCLKLAYFLHYILHKL